MCVAFFSYPAALCHKQMTCFCKDCIWTCSRRMADIGVTEGTDRHRYCGTQCLGKLMNDFPANLAQRPLRIASQLTFASQPVYRNHYTHHEGLASQNTPSQARRQSTRSVYMILLIASLKVCFAVLFLGKEKRK